MTTLLKQDFDWYLEHQDELVSQYNGKIILVHNRSVIGAFDSHLAADVAGRRQFVQGEYLLQRVSPGNQDYTTMAYGQGFEE